MSDLFSLFDQIVDTPKIVKPIIKPKIKIIIENISKKSIRIGDYIFNICYSFDYTQVSYGRNIITSQNGNYPGGGGGGAGLNYDTPMRQYPCVPNSGNGKANGGDGLVNIYF